MYEEISTNGIFIHFQLTSFFKRDDYKLQLKLLPYILMA